MPKVENPLTGKKTDIFNWKSLLGLVGGVFLLLGVFFLGSWIYRKVAGLFGSPSSGSTLNDVLGGV